MANSFGISIPIAGYERKQVGRGTTTPRDRQAGRSLGKGGETPPVASHPVAAARHRRFRPGIPTRARRPRPASVRRM